MPWTHPLARLLPALVIVACGSPPATTQPHVAPRPPGTASPTSLVGPISSPPAGPLPALPALAGVTVPTGFHVERDAGGLTNPTAMAYGPDGRLYVTELQGDVAVIDRPGAPPRLVLDHLASPLGIAWAGDELIVAERGLVEAATLQDGALRDRRTLLSNLPAGEHQQDGLAVGGDGRVMLGSGSTCDLCAEPDPRSAAVLSFRPDGTDLRIVASGLRNPYGLAFQPGTGRLYATVNGADHLDHPGDPEPADMAVVVREGARYGWPACFPNARHLTLSGACDGVTPPAVYFGPHASADGAAFMTGTSFPTTYRGNLFVAEWGMYFSNAGPGSRVARVVLSPDGTASNAAVSVFATGIAHPLALAVDPWGALLVADWGSGQIVRIQSDGAP